MNFKSLLVKSALVVTAASAVAVPAAMAATSASAATVSTMSASVRQLPPTPDQLHLVFQGHTYNYNVRLRTQWVAPGTFLVRGYLTDSYEPQAINLPVRGVIFGNGDVVLSVQYPTTGPDAGNQGLRTFSGQITGPHGQVTGVWDETGTEAGSGPFTLDRV